MLELETLEFKNIGRFVTDQVINFTVFNGLIQVDGLNKNTGGSSASAKTTLFQALDYLLGINDTPVTILQSRLTKESIWVKGNFKDGDKKIVMERSKKGFSIIDGAETIKGSNKLAEERLLAILGMPPNLFRVLLHKRQKEGGFFLNFTPKQVHEFLVDAKNLKDYTTKAASIDKDLSKLEELKKQLDSTLQAANSGLQSTLDALSSIGAPPEPSAYTESYIATLGTTLELYTAQLNEQEFRQAQERQNLVRYKPDLSFKPFDRSEINGIDKDLANLMSQIFDLNNKEKIRQNHVKDQISAIRMKIMAAKAIVDKGDKAKTEAQRIVTELKKLKEGFCPTCSQGWITESAKEKEKELLQSFETQKTLILAGADASKETESLLNEIEAFTPQMVPVSPIPELKEIDLQVQRLRVDLAFAKGKEVDYNLQQNDSNKFKQDDYLAQVKNQTERHAAELTALKDEIFKLKQVLNTATANFTTAKMSGSRYQATLDSLKAQENKRKVEIANANASLEKLKESEEIVNEAKLLVKSFVSCSFDEALESIGDKATSIVRGIPNMQTATIQLEGTRETQEGTVREEVTAVLSIDGEQGVPIKSLSGGERSAMDLAIDLAVIDFLESETGKGMNLFILDEPFTGLGPVEIEPILEMLQNSNLSKKIIIVDHNEIVKQSISNKIMVVRTGDFSQVEAGF